MNTTLIGSMIGVNFGVTNYFVLGIISIVFIVIIVSLFVFVRIKKVSIENKDVSLKLEDLSRVGLAKKKKQGKYFWD